ncbi:DUF4173 domain-containing protein [Pedobacter sp. AW1-32]|uniref:DUF4153 domain-containing protein n=1 Tax=Pedobacter sp. AW1-32 TaxID=3383026 RepID=UPI003FEDBF36
MKNKSNLILGAILIGGLLFSCFFWSDRLALNLLLYSVFIMFIVYLTGDRKTNPKFKLFGCAHILAAILVVVNNSDLSLVAYYISFLLFIGFSRHHQLKSVFAAALSVLIQFITVPVGLYRIVSKATIGNYSLRPVLRPIKYVVLPFFIFMVFFAIYCASNDVFAHFADLLGENLSTFFKKTFSFIFDDISLPRFFHFCFGILITAGLTIGFEEDQIEKIESALPEELFRKGPKSPKRNILTELVHVFFGSLMDKKLALKTEYIIGLISFAALNFLLLGLNLIDITTLWFGYKPTGNFSADLHKGTESLIFSIVLAMMIILYFFRGNLNFYYKRKPLQYLAYLWIIQNLILIVSVLLRDSFYIEFYGLTHKRIGVLVFAILCIIGLGTVYFKVAKQKTLFYLLKLNGSIWFVLLLGFSTINWDIFITRYNLAYSNQISLDVDYLLSLSDKTLPLLDKNRAKIHTKNFNINSHEVVATPFSDAIYLRQLDQRIKFLKERYENVSWLSWNWPDYKAAEYFGFSERSDNIKIKL